MSVYRQTLEALDILTENGGMVPAKEISNLVGTEASPSLYTAFKKGEVVRKKIDGLFHYCSANKKDIELTTCQDLAAKFHISVRKINKTLNDRNIPVLGKERQRHLYSRAAAEAAIRHKLNLRPQAKDPGLVSIDEMRREFDLSGTSVRRRLKKAGIKPKVKQANMPYLYDAQEVEALGVFQDQREQPRAEPKVVNEKPVRRPAKVMDAVFQPLMHRITREIEDVRAQREKICAERQVLLETIFGLEKTLLALENKITMIIEVQKLLNE